MKGRPTSFTNERAELIVDRVRKGLSFSSACQSAGVPSSTGSDWRAEFSEFSDAIAIAEKESEMELLDILRQSAIGYEVKTEKITVSEKDGEKLEETKTIKRSPSYAAWILARRFPEHWSEKHQIEKLVQAQVREVIRNIMEVSSENTRTEVATIIAARPEIMEVDTASLAETEG